MTIFQSTEFWSAIAGAFVGGLIAFAVQWIALREGRLQRQTERRSAGEALANALLVKLLRIHSNFIQIHRHVEECSAKGSLIGMVEAWQMTLPIANPPDQVHFSADEMSMILGQKDVRAFNAIVDLDVRHNSLIDVVKAFNVERNSLGERLAESIQAFEGAKAGAVLTTQQLQQLRPKMIDVNSLVESIRTLTAENIDASHQGIELLQSLLQEKFGLTYAIKPTQAA